jgi:hypothetical protein
MHSDSRPRFLRSILLVCTFLAGGASLHAQHGRNRPRFEADSVPHDASARLRLGRSRNHGHRSRAGTRERSLQQRFQLDGRTVWVLLEEQRRDATDVGPRPRRSRGQQRRFVAVGVVGTDGCNEHPTAPARPIRHPCRSLTSIDCFDRFLRPTPGRRSMLRARLDGCAPYRPDRTGRSSDRDTRCLRRTRRESVSRWDPLLRSRPRRWSCGGSAQSVPRSAHRPTNRHWC